MPAFSLAALEAEFHRYDEREEEGDFVAGDPATWEARGRPTERRKFMQQYMVHAPTLAEAQGIWFLCPLCYAKNGGSAGTHRVVVSFAGRNVPDHQGSAGRDGRPTRWQVAAGSGLADLVLSPSIQLLGGCAWHGFVGMSGIPPGHAG